MPVISIKKMKKLISAISIFLLSFPIVNGQQSTLIVDAGNDTCVCFYSETILGGNPTVQGGTPPYTYYWYGVYEVWPGLLYQYASDILNDTTLANPSIIGASTYFDSYVINLLVLDVVGNQGWDSIFVCSPRYVCLAWNPDASIIQGDSVMLYKVCGGGFEPHTYLWAPPDGLSDPTNLNTYASPEQSTWYSLDMWDSCGCSLGLQGMASLFYVHVFPVGLDSISEKDEYTIIPNPNSGTFQIQSVQLNEKVNIQIYNTMGKIVSDLDIITSETVNLNNLNPGLYFMHIKTDMKETSILKMIIE